MTKDKRKGMKHPYGIEDGVACIYITNRNNDKFTAKMDEEDFVKILDEGWGFSAVKYKTSAGEVNYYVSTTLYVGDNQYHPMLIHRYIMNAPEGMDVDHLNHDTLDNRKCNLMLKSRSDNAKNRTGANKNTTSGERNVCWVKKEQKWVVQLQIDGKGKCFGRFNENELDKAIALARKMRKEIYGKD